MNGTLQFILAIVGTGAGAVIAVAGLTAWQYSSLRADNRDLRVDMKQQAEELRSEMNRGFDKVDARFDKVDARFDKVDARFDKVDAELRELASRTAHLEGQFQMVDRLVIRGAALADQHSANEAASG